MTTIREWQKDVYKNSTEHGWNEDAMHCGYVGNDPNPQAVNYEMFGARMALIHSEVSEALEEGRVGCFVMYYVNDKQEGVVVELADVIIRCLDLAEALKLDIESAMVAKHEYNKTRPYRHGNKKL